MTKMPKEVMELINDPASHKILATRAADGGVHAIEVGSIMAPDANTIMFGAILMKHSGKNLEAMKAEGTLASILVANQLRSFQVRGKVKDFVTSGPIFDKMNEELGKHKMAAQGVWLLEPVEVWDQSANPKAGTRLA